MSAISPSQRWSCQNCSEKIELQFDNCWKCGSNQEGKVQADFDKLLSIPSETTLAHDETESVGQKRGIPWSTFALVSILILSIMFGVRFASKGDVVVFAVAWIIPPLQRQADSSSHLKSIVNGFKAWWCWCWRGGGWVVSDCRFASSEKIQKTGVCFRWHRNASDDPRKDDPLVDGCPIHSRAPRHFLILFIDTGRNSQRRWTVANL